MPKVRRIEILFPVFAVAVAWLGLTTAHARAADAEVTFRRGIGVSHVMAWAAIEPGPLRKFVFPPFSDVSDAQFAAELQAIRRVGFDFVRLAVDPGPFLQFHAARRDDLDRLLIDRAKLILASGLAVIVDFHPSDMHPDYTAQALTAGAATPAFADYVRLLARSAALLAGFHSDKIALELMNEPPVRPAAWQPMLEACYAAVRGNAADLPVVLEGGQEASPAALTAMPTTAFAHDRATFFSFHYYEPYQFTHQGASWNPARYLADVPYPALARPLQDSLQATAALIAASDLPQQEKILAYRDAEIRLKSYRRSAFDRDTVVKDFREIADWARSHGVAPDRVLLGEFGARQTALQFDRVRAAERAQWFLDVRQAAEAFGFGWAAWAYRGGGFALAPDGSGDIEPAIAQALGLGLDAGKPRKSADMPHARNGGD
jgi:endoglucanase